MVLHKGQNPIEKIQLANSQKSSMVKFTISRESGLAFGYSCKSKNVAYIFALFVLALCLLCFFTKAEIAQSCMAKQNVQAVHTALI